MTVTGAVVRPGRRVQVVDTVVEQGGVEVAWGRAVRIRVDPDLDPPGSVTPEDPAPDPPERGTEVPSPWGRYRAFHNAGVGIRYVSGRSANPARRPPGSDSSCPVVAGEEPSPEQRAVAVSDFGNGISAELDVATSVFINPDLTVHLVRPPEGEWVCLDARTRFGPPGTGLAESALWDARGRIGRALQSLYIESRAGDVRRVPRGDAERRRPAPRPGRRRPPGRGVARPGPGRGPRSVAASAARASAPGFLRTSSSRRTWGSCSGTSRSTCSGWARRPWPVRWWSGSTRRGGARPWPATSGAPTAGCW